MLKTASFFAVWRFGLKIFFQFCCVVNLIVLLQFHFQATGGISSGDTIKETAFKESFEEANITESLASQMKPAGCVR